LDVEWFETNIEEKVEVGLGECDNDDEVDGDERKDGYAAEELKAKAC
jgi:hypothetical protein